MGPKRMLYPENAMEAAVQSVKYEKKGTREAAKLHGVPYATLRGRLKGRTSMRKVNRTALSTHNEGILVSWLEESARRGFGRTRSQILNTAQAVIKDNDLQTPFTNGRPGRSWFEGFIKRHKELSIRTNRTPKALGSQRALVSAGKIKWWFNKAYKDIMAVDTDLLNHPDRLFNCDETGFQFGGDITKVVTPKKDKRIHQMTHQTHKQVTVLACASASGEVHPPLLIFPGQRFSYDPLAGFPEAHFSKSVNGCIDATIFAAWLKTAFIPTVADLMKPVILFVDGFKFKTYLSLEVSELCKDHNIILYQLPSQLSHIVQPLGLTTFKNLKQAWMEEVIAFQEKNSDTLGKREFSHVLKKAWQRGIKKDIVVSGFRAAGLYPWDPDPVDLPRLGPSRQFDPSTSAMTDVVPRETEMPTETEIMAVAETGQTVEDSEVTETETGHARTDDTAIIPPAPNLSPESPSNTSSASALPLPPLSPSYSVRRGHFLDLSSSTDDPPPTVVTATETRDTDMTKTSSLDDISPLTALDRLLDVTARVGIDRMFQFRTLQLLKQHSPTDDPDKQLFTFLYDRLTNRLKDTDNIRLSEVKINCYGDAKIYNQNNTFEPS